MFVVGGGPSDSASVSAWYPGTVSAWYPGSVSASDSASEPERASAVLFYGRSWSQSSSHTFFIPMVSFILVFGIFTRLSSSAAATTSSVRGSH